MGDDAKHFTAPINAVLAVKSARVSDFGGRSLSFTSGSSLAINPDHGSADHLKEWYEYVEFQQHHLESITTQQTYINTPTKLLSQIKDENLGRGDKPDYFNVQATVLFSRKIMLFTKLAHWKTRTSKWLT
ncbi:replication protein A 70 kDa DNA-binding subunit-like [Corticium candelabrum]|uniref:replication protein A 70 kDa DNA-binding subunit-like n=1 Tax=Corticium candelabrum TaxID=121492 RepID=UPI002E318C77|nr:replication protein A 70 kDa DNA-binding subunit-like [Corticium candelabrum]